MNARNTICNGCTAKAVDHAIICPALGVIAAGKCKRIRRMPERKAFEHLYGLLANPNRRSTIQLRSRHWHGKTDSYGRTYHAYDHEGFIMAPRTAGNTRRSRATSGGVRNGQCDGHSEAGGSE